MYIHFTCSVQTMQTVSVNAKCRRPSSMQQKYFNKCLSLSAKIWADAAKVGKYRKRTISIQWIEAAVLVVASVIPIHL